MDIRQSAIDRTKGKDFEDFIPYPYLDSSSKVTLGYGHLVPTGGDMDDINMSDGAAAATNDAKEAAWTTIKGKAPKKPASYYKPFTTVRIAQGDAETLLKADLTQAANDLLVRFPDLDSYPESAQDGLLDMMFNIGLTKFTKTSWPSFFQAVLAKDWATAAVESHRDAPISDNRNDAIKQLFLDAVGSKAMLDTARALPGMEQLLQRQMDALLALGGEAGKPGKLFPNGITKIRLAVTAGPVSVTVEIDGPPAIPSS